MLLNRGRVSESENLCRGLYPIWLDGDQGTRLRPRQMRVTQNLFITSLPRRAPRDYQEARIQWKKRNGRREPLHERLRLRKRAALLIVDQRNRNGAVSHQEQEILPQIGRSPTMGYGVGRTSSFSKKRDFLFVIKHKLRRPAAGFEVEIDGEQPIEDGLGAVWAPGPAIYCAEPSSRFRYLINDRVGRYFSQKSVFFESAKLSQNSCIRVCDTQAFGLSDGAVASELDKRVEKLIRAHVQERDAIAETQHANPPTQEFEVDQSRVAGSP